jgi:hypothetical protein
MVILFGCTQRQTNDKTIIKIDTLEKVTPVKIELPKNKADRLKYHTDKDSVFIYSQADDILKFSKEEFNDVVDNFPELTSMNTLSPDSTYGISDITVELVDIVGNKKQLSFDSEAGQDDYYMLYAYFLKEKNGIAKYATRRNKLFEIYNTLNSIFGNLRHGGTYFGHQYSRIEGYAEYSIYWYRHYEDYFDRPYNIEKQKAFYIGGLKQLILDEEEIDFNTVGVNEKAERRKKLFAKVSMLDKEITDNFYLRMAQSFQSDHY